MGDDGKFYVPSESVSVYRDEILSQADVITPNSFETELLTGIKVVTKSDAIDACAILHGKGVRNVIVTGLPSNGDEILLVGSYYQQNRDALPERLCDATSLGERVVFSIAIPTIAAKFTGAGDIFSALLLGYLSQDTFDMQAAVEKAVSSTYGVLKRTYEGGGGELRVIESKGLIEQPQILFRATRECV